MKQKSMTALVSAFARAYHSRNYKEKILNDYLAEKILSDDEYYEISSSMVKGISFFNPLFKGDNEEALRWIVDKQLSPTPIGRAVFTEKSLKNAVSMGVDQYIMLASGYDSFPYRRPEWADKLEIFEIDQSELILDKQRRIDFFDVDSIKRPNYISVDLSKHDWINCLVAHKNFIKDVISFYSLLGVSYYLKRDTFENIFQAISHISPKGTSIVFDYPDENTYTDRAGERTKQVMMAGAANEKMLASYSYSEIEKILSDRGFLVYEHLRPNEITKQYFEDFNKLNPNHKIEAFDNVNYCLAVKA